MNRPPERLKSWPQRRRTLLGALAASREGAIAPIMAIFLVPMVGLLGMATEASAWFMTQRAMQSAADAAVVAAATNGCDPTLACKTTNNSASYLDEAKAVTAAYGYTNGANNVTVTAANKVACPITGTATCYSVTVSQKAPIYLLPVAGFLGDTTVGAANAQTITATAIASAGKTVGFPLVGMEKGNFDSIDLRGAPKANFNGASLFSFGNANCTGGAGATLGNGVAEGTSNCGTPLPNQSATSGIGLEAEQEKAKLNALASNIPADSCGGVYNGQTGIPADLSAYTSANPYKVCGTLNITTTTTLTTATPGSVIIIYNGNLNFSDTTALNGPTTSGLTIIFSGLSSQSAGFMTGPKNTNSTLNIGAPTTGTWSGVALYQDPRMTTVTSSKYSGFTPTFDVTGLIYLPFDNLELDGAVNKQTNGKSCISLWAYTVVVKGTGNIFANSDVTSECALAGLILPGTSTSGTRPQVVQ